MVLLRRTGFPWRVWVALALMCLAALLQTARAADCKRAYVVNNKTDTYETHPWDVSPWFEVNEMVRSKVPDPAASQWLTPGTDVIVDYIADRVVCFQTVNKTTPIFLKVVPTQAYLDALKANGLDLRIDSTHASEIMLLRDRVAANVGLLRPMRDFYASQVDRPVDYERPWRPLGAVYEKSVPWVEIFMTFVVTDTVTNRSNAQRALMTPDPTQLSIQILDRDDEAGAMIIQPQPSTAVAFPICAPPIIRIDRSGTDSADIHFGKVPLDALKQESNAVFEESFSIELRHAAHLAECSVGTRQPKMRFIAAGRFLNGRFEGELSNAAYPGNAMVGVELREGAAVVRGANRGETDPATFLVFDGSRSTRTFTARLRHTVWSTDRIGPFLIPVTLDAFYH
ncbi:hypothetical protein [Pigmentiphaga litoralis]|uniref:Type 1 fimbria pilin n=1 Tax=Pigmentiphaga litoralis TaxID=516702 RepID=A0A7Y9IY97_9BURK|nr:hypothetical protein [Pigmentiphaga litoralis]NYE21991.1 type 1 fimbria pilin [Pigmentiphaga litoralis]NYE84394.1 type 1 fimbria pilin [Pigmentiphaga litoralis]